VTRLRHLPWKRLVVFGGAGSFLLLVAAAAIAYASTDVPEPDDLAVAGVTRVLYADGSEIGRVGGQNRIPVPLDRVPPHVREAVLAAEDRGFYTEPGISPKGIVRALFTNVSGGGDIQQGGSTITQQYAKNAFLSTERTYTRKVKEILIALKMTRQLPKETILEDYLNTIYFGRGAYGIQVAASTYFGKPVEALTPEEGAVLAASIRSPATYDPEDNPERAKERWQYVVDGMVAEGWLDAGQRAAMVYPAVQPASAADVNNDLSGPKGHVIRKVMDELEIELSERGLESFLPGGVTVTTTLQRPAQDAAVAAVQEVVGTAEAEEGLKGALVSIDPRTGGVIAYYGGATGTGFDYASQGAGRQPGSSFKPYVLAAALDDGISLRSTFDGNSPKDFPGIEEPIENFGRRDHGRVTALEATQKSVNTAYFELGLEVGPSKVAELASNAGISTPLASPEGTTEGGISLGIYNVRVIDQAVGYASFANGGLRVTPHMIDNVRRGEQELFRIDSQTTRAFSEDVAADTTFALQQVVRAGTGTRARLSGGRPAAGKTGTTSDNYDAWFAGYTPQLATAVWVGTGQNITIEIDGVREATGGSVSAGIWKAYTEVALDGQPVEEFPEPANIGRQRTTTVDDDDDDDRTRAPRRPVATAESQESASPTPTASETATAEPTQSASPTPKASATSQPTPSSPPTVEPTIEPEPEPEPEPEEPSPTATVGTKSSPSPSPGG
jgi:membrane peptidoglycan carboxypeptidase